MALAVGDGQAPLDREGYLKMANYPLIKQFDMNEEMRLEAVEICASGEPPARLSEQRIKRQAASLFSNWPRHDTCLFCITH